MGTNCQLCTACWKRWGDHGVPADVSRTEADCRRIVRRTCVVVSQSTSPCSVRVEWTWLTPWHSRRRVESILAGSASDNASREIPFESPCRGARAAAGLKRPRRTCRHCDILVLSLEDADVLLLSESQDNVVDVSEKYNEKIKRKLLN